MTETREEIERKLAEMDRIVRAATPGPWWVEWTKEEYLTPDAKRPLIKYRWDDVPTWIAEGSDHHNAQANFEFIALARTLVPELVALARSLLPARDVAEAAVAKQAASIAYSNSSSALNHTQTHAELCRTKDVFFAALARYAAAEDKP